MVNLTFEIEDFDIATLIKEIATIEGITINIFAGDAIGQAESAVQAVEVRAPNQSGKIIPDLTELSKRDYDKATQEAINLRNGGYSWKEIGQALGMAGKSAHRRLSKYEKKVAFKLEKSNKPKPKKEAKPAFEGLSDKELYTAVYGYVTSGKDTGQPLFANHFANALSLSLKNRHEPSKDLKKFLGELHDKTCNAMHMIATALGISAAMAGPTNDAKGKPTVQILVLNPKKVIDFDKLWKMIEKTL